MPVISEAAPLVLEPHMLHKQSLNDLDFDAVTPVLHMVTRDRGTGEDHDDLIGVEDRERMANEFDYKSRYEKLLHEYEELQEFTDWENKLGIEPDAEATYKMQLETLDKERRQLQGQLVQVQQEKASVEYLFEQQQKKAEQRERDLVEMLEEWKSGALVNGAVEEKRQIIKELQEKNEELSKAIESFEKEQVKQNGEVEEKQQLMKELQEKNEELLKANKSFENEQVKQNGDVEQRLAQMSRVEVEVEELKNQITVLTHTILTLEMEKKEMSIRFNESVTGLTMESSQMVTTAMGVTLGGAVVQTEERTTVTAMEVDGESKLQQDYDEMSGKVMDLLEENEELKLRAEEAEVVSEMKRGYLLQ